MVHKERLTYLGYSPSLIAWLLTNSQLFPNLLSAELEEAYQRFANGA